MKISVDVSLTPRQLAEAFEPLIDEEQAQFFIEVAAMTSDWADTNMTQWHAVGRHLATCECSSDEARHLIFRIADGIRAGMRGS